LFVGAGVAVLTGFAVLAFVGLAAFALVVFAGEFTAGVFAGSVTGVAVLTGAGVETFAGLFAFALFAGASPHAIPSALNPRTVESTITFVILFKTPIIYLKE